MIRVAEAFEIVAREAAKRRLPDERRMLRDAVGCVASEDITSPIDLPPFDKSAMDGYAIPDGEFLDEYIVDGIIAAGQYIDTAPVPGHAFKVMTGAAVQPGTARVVIWEDTEESSGRVKIIRKSDKTNIARRGEDLNKGGLLCRNGTVITPLTLANIALGGIDEVNVSARPKVAVFSTGDELLPGGADIEPGKIYDSNGPMLESLVRKLRIEICHRGHLRDDLSESVKGLKDGLAKADVVLFSGAVSKGDYDFLPDAFRDVGLTTHFNEIAVKPGKPTTFATSDPNDKKMVFGLPGNPVSSFLMFHMFVLPAIYMMQGSGAHPRVIKVRLADKISTRKSERDQFVPAKFDTDGRVKPLPYHGSGHLLGLADADGFLEIESGMTGIDEDASAPFLPMMMHAYSGNK